MLFGEKFYRLLNELSMWQQSLFALVLAQRMSQNFYLYTNIIEDHKAEDAFKEVIKKMWQFHLDKHNEIDLAEEQLKLEEHTPTPKEDDSYGVYPALDACQALAASIGAIVDKNGDEAEIASNASICTVAKYLEIKNDKVFEDDELCDDPLMAEEMNFQVDLISRIKQKRDEKWIRELKNELDEIHYSNIGITTDEQ